MSDPTLQLLQYIKEGVDRLEDKLSSHNDRINGVEKWQSNADGKITMFGLFCSASGAFIAWLIGIFKH